ncbi:hypothetical protein T12_13936 [Trichinella patagoniensis]|uniref:Uncharacterized protein n=1 Tax=Trichinella patagoniensis TaxID=990121 RepID=A0A0V0ZVS0_9BILA|nr:hypothetical protein T12_13936 [Trichinella patagoniensis]
MGNERVASQFSYEQLNQDIAGLVGQFCLLEKLKKLAIDVAICRLSTTDKSHLRCHADEPAGSGLPETKLGGRKSNFVRGAILDWNKTKANSTD